MVMQALYRRDGPSGFGKPQAADKATTPSARKTAKRAVPAASTPIAKPLKRPSQARARFTVQAIFDAFVRIWQREEAGKKGWAGVSTRAVALEAGVSVGTLYDYFPSKEALLSGYVRHCMEALLQAIDQQAVQPKDLPWRQRLHHLVRLNCGVDTPELPWFAPGMLSLEDRIAEPKHHRRVHDELLAVWQRVFEACKDLPRRPSPDTVLSLHLAVWGARRYGLLLGLDAAQSRAWASQMERVCLLAVDS